MAAKKTVPHKPLRKFDPLGATWSNLDLLGFAGICLDLRGFLPPSPSRLDVANHLSKNNRDTSKRTSTERSSAYQACPGCATGRASGVIVTRPGFLVSSLGTQSASCKSGKMLRPVYVESAFGRFGGKNYFAWLAGGREAVRWF